MAKWQTRTLEVRVGKPMGVRVSPSALSYLKAFPAQPGFGWLGYFLKASRKVLRAFQSTGGKKGLIHFFVRALRRIF